jgi:hypothetical protein
VEEVNDNRLVEYLSVGRCLSKLVVTINCLAVTRREWTLLLGLAIQVPYRSSLVGPYI